MKVKLILTDMDGTLFADGEQIPKINRRALLECEARGIRLALVSGRGHGFLSRVAKSMGLKCAIASANGARIEASPDGPLIFEGAFPRADGQSMLDLLYNMNVNFECYAKGVSYVLRADRMPPRHRASLMRNVERGDADAVFDEERARREAPERAYKFVVFSDDADEINAVRRALDERGIAHCSSGSQNVEIMPPGVGKGEAVLKIASYFGCAREETMAFGDYTNDIPMLRACGHPVAMRNGVEAVRRVARIIAPPNTQGGLGQVIYRYVLAREPSSERAATAREDL